MEKHFKKTVMLSQWFLRKRRVFAAERQYSPEFADVSWIIIIKSNAECL
jgi:hypothetical protein